MSVETIGSSVYWRMPSSGPASALLGEGRVDLLDGRVARDTSHTRSTTEPVITGARTAMPFSLPSSSGMHEADRLGRAGRGRDQVDRGRARAAQVLVRRVLEALVGRVGVDRGHDPALDPDRVVQHLRHRARGSWWCRRRSR